MLVARGGGSKRTKGEKNFYFLGDVRAVGGELPMRADFLSQVQVGGVRLLVSARRGMGTKGKIKVNATRETWGGGL